MSLKGENHQRFKELRQLGMTDYEIVLEVAKHSSAFRLRRIWRELRGFTLEELSELCTRYSDTSVDARTLSYWERFPKAERGRKLGLSELLLLSKALKTSVHELVDAADMDALPRHEASFLKASAETLETTDVHSTNQSSAEMFTASGIAAQRSAEHLSKLPNDRYAEEDIQSIFEKVVLLSRQHLHIDSLELFNETLAVRDQVYRLLERGSSTKQLNDLFLFSSILSLLLADTCIGVGALKDAQRIAKSAFTDAQQAKHSGLKFWAKGQILAACSRWDDCLREALELTQSTEQYLSTPEIKSRYFITLAGHAARQNLTDHAEFALNSCEKARSNSTHADFLTNEVGGMFAFPEEKELQLVAGIWNELGQYEKAEEAASSCIRIYQSNELERRAFGNQANASVNLAIARAHGSGGIEGVEDALSEIFELPPQKRQRWIVSPLRNLVEDLPTQSSRKHAILRDKILDFQANSSENFANMIT